MDVDESTAQILNAAKQLYEQLHLEWFQSSPNFKKCGELLLQLKVLLIELTCIPYMPGEQENEEALLLTRNVLEIGVQWSIETKDVRSFERYMAQLKSYYLDFERSKLPESKQMYTLIGLNLLYLLSQNRVAEFHTELELLPADKLETNMYIKHPVSLEQCLMEGRYNKIFAASHIVPDPSYHFFMEILVETVRNEIATGIESLFTEVTLSQATELLHLKDQQAALIIADKRNWKVNPNGRFVFELFKEEQEVKEVEPPDYMALMSGMLEYAREMESIV